MATKVKPIRLQITGTPQVGDVPTYVDASTFAWGQGGGGNVKVFEIQGSTDYVTATAARDAYLQGDTVVVMYGTDAYQFTSGTVLYGDIPSVFSASAITFKMITLTVDGGGTVTAISTSTMTYNGPTVEDNLTSTSATNALSANQGRILDGKIADLMALGKFLSLWNSATGQPVSFPQQTPYTYNTGDYFLVSTVSTATPPVNYKPNGSSYTGTASSTTESDDVEIGDMYIYDGTTWLLQLNHGKTVSFSEIAGQPTDNTNLATALGNKQDTLIAGTNISIAADGKTISATDTTYTAGTGISITSNAISNTGVTSFNGGTGAVTYTAPVSSVNGNTGAVTLDADDISDTGTTNQWTNATEKGTWNGKQDAFHTIDSTAPANPTQGDEWYDTTNDVLKTFDGTNWNTVGAGTGDVLYSDFDYTALSGTTITINNLTNTLTTSADVTVSAGSSLKPGLTYLLRVTNSDTSAHTVTINSEALYLPASSTVNYVLLALTSSTFEYQDPGYRMVATLPATPTPGVIYYVMS